MKPMPRRDVIATATCALLPAVAWGVSALASTESGGAGGSSPRVQGIALGIGTGLGLAGLGAYHLVQRRRLARLRALARGLLEQSGALGAGAEAGQASIDDEAAAGTLASQLVAIGVRLDAHAKEAAKKSRNLEALIDGLDEPVLAFGAQDAVIFCNRPAETMIGAGPGRLIGRTVRELFTRDEIVRLHEQGKAGRTARAQVPVVSASGLRTYQVSAAPLPPAWGAGRFGALLVLRDVTELAQAVQMRTDFVANASHELRTPVAAIKVAAETLLDGARDDAGMADRLLGMIGTHATRLEEMVRDLMDLSRLESTEMPVRPGELDLDELRATLASTFEPALRQRRLGLNFEFDPRLAGATTDPRLVLLILRNLVDNATKYAHEQTTVRVVVRLLDDAAREAAGERTMRLEVIDKGVGIPLNQQERVFERFFQVDQARTGATSKRGTGLGLAIVKHAVRALGGRVGIDSIWGRGTTVWVEAAVNVESAASAPASGAEGAGEAGRGRAPEA